MIGEFWHYASGEGQYHGPISTDQLRQLLINGHITLHTFAWQPGMADWMPIGSIPGLLNPAGTAPSLTVPVAAHPVIAEQLNYYGPDATNPGSHFRPAGFWLRFVAVLLDWIIIAIPIAMVGAVIFTPVPVFVPANSRQVPPPAFMFNSCGSPALWTIISWLYFALMESSSYQATIGKMAMGLKVTDLEGRRISFGRASGRFFAKYISALILDIGFMMGGWTRYKQALHDMLANTLVIKK